MQMLSALSDPTSFSRHSGNPYLHIGDLAALTHRASPGNDNSMLMMVYSTSKPFSLVCRALMYFCTSSGVYNCKVMEVLTVLMLTVSVL
mgnify:CR=1 FL=1